MDPTIKTIRDHYKLQIAQLRMDMLLCNPNVIMSYLKTTPIVDKNTRNKLKSEHNLTNWTLGKTQIEPISQRLRLQMCLP